ncbi:MAG: alpha/beta hydrolase family protein [Myxococcota bacterium]
MFEQPLFSKWSALGIAGGLIWLSAASGLGFVASLPVLVLGGLMLGSGVSQLFWPGDQRATQIGAFAGLVGALLSLPYMFGVGFGSGLLLLGAALGAGWGAGRMALQLEPHHDAVPDPKPSAALGAKVALDEAILGFEQFSGSSGFALDGTLARVMGEVDALHAQLSAKGLIEKPEAYHETPPDLVDPEIKKGKAGGRDIEFMRFESGYAPPAQEPGRERWLGYAPTVDAHAYVMRHEGAPRPWMICTNGYRMGHAAIDVGLFERFHERLGLNVVIPVLPLHGPRKISWHSGTGFLGLDVLDTVHAEAQSIWDMRRLLSWVKAQEAPGVGAIGLSLGGYTTALFASVAEGLSCAIPGIPLADIPRMVSRHGAAHQFRYAEEAGFDLDRIREVMRVVSPLTLKPRVPLAGRMIFGATADRLVTPDHVRDLWRHWDEPEIVWYNGGHVTFRGEKDVWAGVDRTIREAGLSH